MDLELIWRLQLVDGDCRDCIELVLRSWCCVGAVLVLVWGLSQL